MGYGKAVEKVASTVGRVSDNRVRRNKIKDAGRASQRKLNEADQQKSFYYAGWRVTLAWGLTIAIIYHFVVFPIVLIFIPDAKEPTWDMQSIMAMMSFLLGGLVGARSFDKAKGKETNFTKRLFRR